MAPVVKALQVLSADTLLTSLTNPTPAVQSVPLPTTKIAAVAKSAVVPLWDSPAMVFAAIVTWVSVVTPARADLQR